MLEKLADRKPNVFCDLTQQNRRDVPTLMKRYGRTTAIAMSILLMRSTLPDLDKAKLKQNRHDFVEFENGKVAQNSANSNVLNPHELGFELRIAILKKHRDDLLEIMV